MKDYYAILGLAPGATAAEIDAAFRWLARKYHPDRAPEEADATARFKLASEAHEVLSDAIRRQEYDRRRRREARRIMISDRGGPSNFAVASHADTLAEPRSDAAASESQFHAMSVRAEFSIVPEEAAHGGPVELRITVSDPCSACGGTSRREGYGSCAHCGGTGEVRRSRVLQLQLPAGLPDGAVLRLEGYGRLARPGSPPGDLELVVRVRPSC